MSSTLHAEWTKLRTSQSTWWLLIAAVALMIGLSAVVDAGARCGSLGCGQDPARTSLAGIYVGQVLVAISSVTLISSEFGTGMIRTTLTAMPRRAQVLTAKAATAAGWALAAGVAGVTGSVVVGRIILPGEGFTGAHGYPPLSVSDPAMLRAAVGSVMYLVLISLLSLGVATAVRDSAVGIGVVLGLLFLFPLILVMVNNPDWRQHLEQVGPMTAGLAIQATVNLGQQPISPWAGLGVLALWSAGALGVGAVTLQLRDA